MALEVYFPEDIARIVKSNAFAALMTASAHGAGNVEFVRGALCHAQATCMAFGIDWSTMLENLRWQAQIAGLAMLLDAVNPPLVGK